jgi:hypothetical protein
MNPAFTAAGRQKAAAYSVRRDPPYALRALQRIIEKNPQKQEGQIPSSHLSPFLRHSPPGDIFLSRVSLLYRSACTFAFAPPFAFLI